MLFKHSGQLGDIIYSLPAMISLANNNGIKRFSLIVPNDKPANHAPGLKHISGEIMVSQSMFDFVKPLLLRQEYIDSVDFIPEMEIPSSAIDFDLIRNGRVNLSAGNIKDYYFKVFGLVSRRNGPWVKRSNNASKGGFDVIIGRSTRYINDSIDYHIFNDFDLRVGFVGVDSEFASLISRYPKLVVEHVGISDALEACDLISASRVYVGNQSFFFSIAEALQANRALEVFEPVPNVVPSGGCYGEFINTYGLAAVLAEFLAQSGRAGDIENQEPRYLLSV